MTQLTLDIRILAVIPRAMSKEEAYYTYLKLLGLEPKITTIEPSVFDGIDDEVC